MASSYGDLVAAARRVAAQPARSDKTRSLADYLRTVPPDEIPIAVGLLLGRPRQGRLGVGWSTVADRRPVESSVTELGRPGVFRSSVEPSVTKSLGGEAREPAVESSVTELAGAVASRTVPPGVGWAGTADGVSSLTIRQVDEAMTRLVEVGGAGSQAERARLLDELFTRAGIDEQRHLRQVLTGEVRQGANEGVVAEAVALAAGVPAASVRRAAMLLGDLGATARRALAGEPLDDLGLQVLVGVQPMLASTAASVEAALAEIGTASVEAKLDGARIQVHRRGEEVRIYTRSLREIAASVPEIVDAVASLPGGDLVLDGEALGLDEDGHPLAFQDTMSGGSRLSPFFFDVLHAEGVSLIDRPLGERRAHLAELVPDRLRLASIETADPAVAARFAADVLAAGHEGVMVKALDSTYAAGRRGKAWRKVKPVHTLDLVVLAAEWGSGRRVGWLSNLHLGAGDGSGGFVMVGKTFKGLTDELLTWQTEALQRIALGSDGPVVHVRPELVVEVALDGVQRSRRYPGGVALRFARVRRYRPDKRPAEADHIDRVRAMLPTR